MAVVTRLAAQKRGGGVEIFVDGELWLTAHREAVFACGVHLGVAATATLAAQVRAADERHRAHEAALLLLSYRPRSEHELGERLRRKGLSDEAIEETLARLRANGLVNDARFAEQWIAERGAGSGARGRSLLTAELRAKGIMGEAVTEALGVIDEESRALEVARPRAARLAGLPYADFQRRLAGFLQRRGYGYGAINSAVRLLWRERGGDGEAASQAEE